MHTRNDFKRRWFDYTICKLIKSYRNIEPLLGKLHQSNALKINFQNPNKRKQHPSFHGEVAPVIILNKMKGCSPPLAFPTRGKEGNSNFALPVALRVMLFHAKLTSARDAVVKYVPKSQVNTITSVDGKNTGFKTLDTYQPK